MHYNCDDKLEKQIFNILVYHKLLKDIRKKPLWQSSICTLSGSLNVWFNTLGPQITAWGLKRRGGNDYDLEYHNKVVGITIRTGTFINDRLTAKSKVVYIDLNKGIDVIDAVIALIHNVFGSCMCSGDGPSPIMVIEHNYKSNMGQTQVINWPFTVETNKQFTTTTTTTDGTSSAGDYTYIDQTALPYQEDSVPGATFDEYYMLWKSVS